MKNGQMDDESLCFESEVNGDDWTDGSDSDTNVKDAAITALAERLDLDLGRKYREYSHGNKQKLALILAFMHQPELVILDEPTTGLDPLVQQEFYGIVRDARTAGATIFISSHVLSEVEHVCDRVGIIDQGKILACDTPQRLKAKIASRPSWKIEVTPNIQELDTLKTVPGVIGISEVSNIETGTSTLKLVLEDESVMSDLLSTINKSGSRVLNMGKSEPTLEDVYINLVGKGL